MFQGHRHAKRRTLIAVALLAASCQAAPVATPTLVADLPSAPPSPGSTAAPSLAPVPAGRIVFHRDGPADHAYFTIRSDGTDEQPLGPIGDCAPCVRWSTDGKRIWTMGATGHGTWSLMTMRPDGSDRSVINPPIPNLSLGPGMPSVDGRWIAFDGFDLTDPSRNGLYLASPGLHDLKRVMPLPKGTVLSEPFGVSPDGKRVLFFADRGEAEHPAGDLYIVNADGSGLRQLNPAGTMHEFVEVPVGGLSPDGRQAAFSVDDAVYVMDVAGGEPRRITDKTGFVWAVSWSPTGEWITYTRQYGKTSVVSLVRPDGTDQHDITPKDETAEAADGVWSPDGDHLLVARDSDVTIDGPRDLWIIDLGGTFLHQVTHQPSNYGEYSWAP